MDKLGILILNYDFRNIHQELFIRTHLFIF